jgi:hypothetical protein
MASPNTNEYEKVRRFEVAPAEKELTEGAVVSNVIAPALNADVVAFPAVSVTEPDVNDSEIVPSAHPVRFTV